MPLNEVVGVVRGYEKIRHTSPRAPPTQLSKELQTAISGISTTGWSYDGPEDDDALHNPDASDPSFSFFSSRGWANISALVFLLVCILSLFCLWPILHYFMRKPVKTVGFNLGGINATGQVPKLPHMPSLVDKDTPSSAQSRVGTDGKNYNLVFSDEFNTDGRTFWEGDDPFWEGQDMYYWATGDFEWYDPQAITTENGKLVITMTAQNPINNHNLSYRSGMLTSWNKFCFTTGYVEVSISLPGSGEIPGFWPGAWTMGNLGRAGYGATTEGTWPYSYDSCDAGTFPGQIDKSGNPLAAATSGDKGKPISNLPGQRLSACTCPGEDHPGPSVGVGRSAPEIDILEAQVNKELVQGEISQSFQLAPFDKHWAWDNSTPATTIYDPSVTRFNSFKGTELQQSLSAVTLIDNANYNDNKYLKYAFEWWSDSKHRDDGYITWFIDNEKTWTLTAPSMGPNTDMEIGQRLVSEEPMYLILNLGMSTNFEAPDFNNLKFPAKMYIDYIRVYQRDDVKDGTTCDPPNYPTSDYINRHPEAYSNANWTTWAQAGYLTPRNSKYDGC
ncbi:glycoside hydrolase family 16 protein [Rickenella mellea]|uniref:Glycoside hydrolase family 16 protein n=1 Tax=Rickenella mellea TaxID=50990 RepID=A0A4Y7PWR9_9AGAM|nr:glycoside hydrolase family 16 protein [Rickenella mellea]